MQPARRSKRIGEAPAGWRRQKLCKLDLSLLCVQPPDIEGRAVVEPRPRTAALNDTPIVAVIFFVMTDDRERAGGRLQRL
ncbi:MAG: hypothetical protein NZ553_20010 [Caldilinea sp.]|nr:hypothetical protein [Caldilinea sp.]MDW8442770.1 hypothetical protein [Caldilineaceae bacterium]